MCDTEDCCIAIALALAVKRKKRKKRLWMKERFKKRNELIRENLRNEQRLSSSNDFRNFLQMNEEAYDELIKLITPKIKKRNTLMRPAIPVNQRLSATLTFLASGKTFFDLELITSISEHTISRIVLETCQAITEVLSDYIKIPTTQEEWKQIAEDFNLHWNFPNCLGAVDGKHISIRKPRDFEFYYNYKDFFSIVLMAVVNANYEFIMADISVSGNISDGEVLNHTEFGKNLSENALNLPNPGLLPESDKKLPYIFIGDDAFQLSDHLMKPYSQIVLEEQEIFNYRLSRARRTAENAFGILVSRFAVLKQIIGVAPEKVQTIVLACCYLHNFLLKKSSIQYLPSGSVDKEQLHNGTITQGSWRNGCEMTSLKISSNQNTTSNSEAIRESFCDYFNNEGQVSWQNKFVCKNVETNTL